jgi:hypothetical protein
MNHPARLLPLLLAALTLPVSQLVFPGCATITQGPLQKVKFDSKPAGATVYLNGKSIGVTPRLVVLSRFRSPRVRFELAGFQPYELKLESQAQWLAVEGNILLGFAPIVIDAVTGSLYQISPSDRSAPGLVRYPWYKDTDQYALFVGVILKPVPNARKIGQLQRR